MARYLFFTNTPAHVHLYRNAAEILHRDHEVLVLARDYGCTVDLLEYYDLPFEVYGRCETTKGSLFRELPRHYAKIFATTLRYQPDCIFGIGGYAAPAGAISRTPTVLIHDSEPTTLDHAISRQFAKMILTPHAFQKDLGEKHYRFKGFKEIAYLHPDAYEPSGELRPELGLAPGEQFAIVRFNAFGSHHDVGHDGFSATQRRQLLEQLSEHVTVYVSDEGGTFDFEDIDAEPFDLHPALLHDALAEASLVVTDTQTIATETALLGTPVIRSNSFVGDDDMGNFIELAEQGLITNLESFEEVRDTAMSYLQDDDVAREWERRRDEYIDGLTNLTNLIVTVATNPNAADQLDRLWSTQTIQNPTQLG